MKTLVTGSTGFLGRHLFDALKGRPGITHTLGTTRDWNAIEARDRYGRMHCDLTSETSILRLFDDYQPDVIFHLAANPIVKDAGPGLTRDNILVTHLLAHHAPRNSRFVLASSATVYGDDAEHATEHQLHKPTTVYGMTKVAAEYLLHSLRPDSVALRLVAMVGPGQGHGLVRDIIMKLKSESPTMDLLGDAPGSTKPQLHVSDAVAAFLHFGLDSRYRGSFNISTGDALSVETVAHLVMQAVGVKKEIRWLGEVANWKGDNRRVNPSTALAANLGWRSSLNSVEAVTRAAQEQWGAA